MILADFLKHKMGYFTELACRDVPCKQVSSLSLCISVLILMRTEFERDQMIPYTIACFPFYLFIPILLSFTLRIA